MTAANSASWAWKIVLFQYFAASSHHRLFCPMIERSLHTFFLMYVSNSGTLQEPHQTLKKRYIYFGPDQRKWSRIRFRQEPSQSSQVWFPPWGIFLETLHVLPDVDGLICFLPTTLSTWVNKWLVLIGMLTDFRTTLIIAHSQSEDMLCFPSAI